MIQVLDRAPCSLVTTRPSYKIGSSRNLRFVFLSRCSISPVHNSCRFHRLATIWFIFLPGQAIEGWAKTQIYGREKEISRERIRPGLPVISTSVVSLTGPDVVTGPGHGCHIGDITDHFIIRWSQQQSSHHHHFLFSLMLSLIYGITNCRRAREPGPDIGWSLIVRRVWRI